MAMGFIVRFGSVATLFLPCALSVKRYFVVVDHHWKKVLDDFSVFQRSVRYHIGVSFGGMAPV
jgi:hypothetical protein